MQCVHKKKVTRAAKILRAVIAMICIIAVACAEIAYAATEGTSDPKKLLNGSFEEGQTFTGNYLLPNQSAVPSWNTTAFQGRIELFKANTGTYISGVKLQPTDGSIAAELNANEESTLYQNVKTTPSSVYEWGLDHGGRNGKDIMALVIGPKQGVDPSKPNMDGRDQFMQMVDWLNIDVSTIISGAEPKRYTVYSKKFAASGTFEDNAGNNAFSLTPSSIYTEEWHIWIMASSRATTGTNPWNSYGSNATSTAGSGNGSGNTGVDLSKYYFYTVPAGQTDTLFAFVSVGYVDSTAPADRVKTFGNFLDNINFQIFHPLSVSTSTHGSAVVGGSDGTSGGTGASSGHEVTVDNNLKTYVTDGETLKIQAVVKSADVADGCQFVSVYHTKQDESGNPVSEFIQVSGNVIEDTGSLTDEEKKGKWVKSTNTNGDVFYTYYIENLTSATDLHFIFIKSPTVTYDPNGGKPYVVERIYNTDESENVYSFKPNNESDGSYTFIAPYVSHAAESPDGKDGWKFMGWKLTGDTVDNVPAGKQVNADQLGSLILPDVHTIACDYTLDGVNRDTKAQYFKIYNGNVSLTETETNGTVSGVTWTDNGETKAYANVHKGITMIAQWRWRQAFIPQAHNAADDTYIASDSGGTVKITSVTDPSDTNYNAAYNENGGKSYHAAIDERITVNATANSGYTFEGWYDESGKLITTNAEYTYIEAKESVKTYYARFSKTVTQTYIRQIKSGDNWTNTDDDTIGTLGRYTYTDAVGKPISSTAAAGAKYKFVGWYDSEGNQVADSMLINNGATISYTTKGDATYYARFVPTVTQKFIRQIKSGDSWTETTEDTIGTLDRYSYTDAVGKPISSTATAGKGYKFVGWYDSEGNQVADSMLINNGATISYTTTGNATYYARFEDAYTLVVSKIDGDQSTEDHKVPLAGAEFTLYQKDDSGTDTIRYNDGESVKSIKCTKISSVTTVLTADRTKATAVFADLLDTGIDYYLAETKAPAGYRLLDAPLKITIDGSGNTALIDGISKEITEKKVNVELANYLTLFMPTSGITFTGGWYAAAGLTLLAAAAIGLFGFKMRRLKSKI